MPCMQLKGCSTVLLQDAKQQVLIYSHIAGTDQVPCKKVHGADIPIRWRVMKDNPLSDTTYTLPSFAAFWRTLAFKLALQML